MKTTYDFFENGDVMATVWLNGKIHDYYCAGVHNVEIFEYEGKRIKADEFNNYFIEFDEDENPGFEAYSADLLD